MMTAEPQQQHKWLERLVGHWTYESNCMMGPDKPREKFTGSESVRSIGGIWVIGEGKGEMPGGDMATTMITLGYDPRTERFVGTWLGSMMTHLWIYDGELSADGNALSLYAEGPDFCNEGKLAKYKDVIAFKSDDHRTLTSHGLGEDGKWNEFMTADYRRGK